MSEVRCQQHGSQKAAIVCQHLLESMHDDEPRGLWVSTDEDGYINAYCNACEDYRLRNGGDWPEDANTYIKAKLLCLECFGKLRKLNGYEVN